VDNVEVKSSYDKVYRRIVGYSNTRTIDPMTNAFRIVVCKRDEMPDDSAYSTHIEINPEEATAFFLAGIYNLNRHDAFHSAFIRATMEGLNPDIHEIESIGVAGPPRIMAEDEIGVRYRQS